MAIYLFKLIRGELRERETQKAIPTTSDTHLVPECTAEQQHQSTQDHYNYSHSEDSTATRTNADPPTPEEAAQHKAEARRRNTRQWKMILGLALPNFLAAVDVTIVAPAMPLISSHFNQLAGGSNWIVAAYTLTFTTFVPASGQLADIYGRHFALQFEMFWIMAGSVLCAAAQSWAMLLVGRALQGLGAAGIMSLSRIVLSDGATLAENARNNSLLFFISGASYAIGPVIGGYLADAGWRYVFVLPVGVAVLAILLIFFLMRKELVQGLATTQGEGSRRRGYINGLAIIDWPGMTMFIFGIGCIILAIQWGGAQYPWDSAGVISPLVLGIILSIAFFIHEYLLSPGRTIATLFPHQIPMIPSTLFHKKDTTLLLIINFSAGVSLVSAFYFISYYWQLAEGYSTSKAGVQLLYYTPGLGIGVYTAMILCNRWPRQTFPPLLIGSIVEGVGLALLTYSVSTRHTTTVKIFLALSGAGTGLRLMPVTLHAAGIWSTRIPSIQSLLSFMVPLGETMGISIMGAVFSNRLDFFIARINGQVDGLGLDTSSFPGGEVFDDLPLAVEQNVRDAAAKAVMWAFVSVLPFAGIAIVASVFLGNVWIGGDADVGANRCRGREGEKGKVMYGWYLFALLTGGVAARKRDLDVNLGQNGRDMSGAVELGATPSQGVCAGGDRSV